MKNILKSVTIILILIGTFNFLSVNKCTAQYFHIVNQNNPPCSNIFETGANVNNSRIGIGIPYNINTPLRAKLYIKGDFNYLGEDPILKIHMIESGGAFSSDLGFINFGVKDGGTQYAIYQQDDGEGFENFFSSKLTIDGGNVDNNYLSILGTATIKTGIFLGEDLTENNLPRTSQFILSEGQLQLQVTPPAQTPYTSKTVMTVDFNPDKRVNVNGILSTERFLMTENAGELKVMASDAHGYGTWTDASLLTGDYWLVTNNSKGFEPPNPSELSSIYLNTHKYKGVLIGTDTNVAGYLLAVNGKILCEELKVKLYNEWPDYVFSKNYPLPSLPETDRYIRENGRLPGVPSAQEMKENGMNVGEMNALLLKKVEELTVHLIAMQKEMEELKAKLSDR